MDAATNATILVVDDHPINVLLLQKLLQPHYRVTTADCGAKALAEASSGTPPDLILLDVMMPDMSGYEVCTRLKADPATMHLPVVMVTALDQPSDKVQGLENGADDFLTKPVDDIALVTRVKNLARLKMLNDEMMMRASPPRSW